MTPDLTGKITTMVDKAEYDRACVVSDHELSQAYSQGWQDGRRELEAVLREATDMLFCWHSPLCHDLIRDEKACLDCRKLAEFRAALAQVAQDPPTKGE